MAAESIEDLFARYGPPYKWLASITCMLGAMTMVLSQTTVNVAFPDIMGAFGIGRNEAQWLSSGFFAAMTAGMLLQAWLVSIFGERATYITSLFGFLVGVGMSGLAPNAETLSAGRLLQGLTAGLSTGTARQRNGFFRHGHRLRTSDGTNPRRFRNRMV